MPIVPFDVDAGECRRSPNGGSRARDAAHAEDASQGAWETMRSSIHGSNNGSSGGASERRRPLAGATGAGASGGVPLAASFDGVESSADACDKTTHRRGPVDPFERLSYWRTVLENAAMSEVAVNVCLPCLVCGRLEGGAFQPPSEITLCFVVLALNLSGCFLEGFFKSTKLLSQALRRSHVSHQLVFIASQGLAEGFLNVATSFPDIASSGSSIMLSSGSLVLGALYCCSQMLGGVLLYHWGRQCGARCVRQHWQSLLHFIAVWPYFARGLVILVFCTMLLLGTPSRTVRSSSSSSGLKGGGDASTFLPLDLVEPGLQGVVGARIVYDEFVFEVPPLALGLAVGISMSASGAIIASIFCSLLFDEKGRPAARLITNFAATLLTLWASSARLGLMNGFLPEHAASRSFILLKFCTSFCGALSAFSGTVGDVTDVYLGADAEESSLDELIQKKGWLPAMTAAQNFLAHLSFTLLIMLLEASPAADAPAVVVPGTVKPMVRELSFQAFGGGSEV